MASSGNNEIIKITSGGTASTFNTGTNRLNQPEGLAFDSSGNLYTTNRANNQIIELNSSGVQTVFATGGNLSGPNFLAFGPASIPEPSSLALVGLMAGGFLVARRWRRLPDPGFQGADQSGLL